MWRRKVADIAKDYRDITFAIVDEDDFADQFKEFGFDESGEELNIGCLNAHDKKYPMSPMDEFDSDEIREFINDFKKGKELLSRPRIYTSFGLQCIAITMQTE